jgi:hypothetical protein
MADIARQVRNKNAHDPRHLTYGHFGKVKYDDGLQQWRFLRYAPSHGEAEGDSAPQQLGLRFLHSQTLTPGINGELGREEYQSYTGPRLPASRALRRQYGLRLALDAAAFDDGHIHEVDDAVCLTVFGYASSISEPGSHSRNSLILISAVPNSQMLQVSSVRAIFNYDVQQILPCLEEPQSLLHDLRKERILGLRFSEDRLLLAVRQQSGTSIVMPVYGDSQVSGPDAGRTSVRLEHIATIPNARTGGHLHADVGFHPSNHNFLGVVDTHGNWSTWEIQGRRSSSARVLYKAKLHGFGKLVPSKANFKQFAENIYFNGWHRICCLERSQDNKALLVCSRRLARMCGLSGEVRGDVDIRLGTPSAKNWILEVKTSSYRSHVCYVLTTTSVQVMYLADRSDEKDQLDLICSWAHFFDRGDLGLGLHVVETEQGMFR